MESNKWYLENVPKGTGRGFEIRICDDVRVIATMERDSSDSRNVLKYSKEQEANAALIAESKNMYYALKVLAELDLTGVNLSNDENVIYQRNNSFIRVKDVLNAKSILHRINQ